MCGISSGFPFANRRTNSKIAFMKVPPKLGQTFQTRVLLLLSLISISTSSRAQSPEVDHIRSHAEAGEPEAQNTMGLACKNGHGVPQDFAQALKWFQKAGDK